MSKDPAFLFYPGDWLGGTITLTRAHKGAYMDLLMAQFNYGHLSIDDIKHILAQDFNSMWETKLRHKFELDISGCFYNKKLEFEQTKRKDYVKSRRTNLPDKSCDNTSHMGLLMKPHMENENINENEIVNIIEKGVRGKKTLAPEYFNPTESMIEWAINVGVLDPLQETPIFLDYHRAKGTLFKSWEAAWRTWMRNHVKFKTNNPGGGKNGNTGDNYSGFSKKDYGQGW